MSEKCKHCVDGVALQDERYCDICIYCAGSGIVEVAPKTLDRVECDCSFPNTLDEAANGGIFMAVADCPHTNR